MEVINEANEIKHQQRKGMNYERLMPYLFLINLKTYNVFDITQV